MGCTSGKQIKKQTTSVEDLSQKKEPVTQVNDAKSPSKNGQIAKQQTNAIQIPGANKSFLAPDGIPFIDEDVEDDTDELNTTSVSDVKIDSVVGNDTTKPANGHSSKTTTTITTTTQSSSALVNGETVTKTTTTHLIDTSEERPQVIGQILNEEARLSKHRESERAGDNFIQVTNNNMSPQEDVAAVRIQAGVRGYLDRKKVKAMRAEHGDHDIANKHHAAADGGGDGRQIITDKTVQIHYGNGDNDDDDHKLNSAATKIQANYKGYKTRKQLNAKN